MNVTARILLSLGLLYSMYLITTRAVALWYFRQGTPEAIQKAIKWDPHNPEYDVTLARLLQLSAEGETLDETIRLYETAVRLSPHRADYWAELGGAYELAGRHEKAQRAYERAQQLFPNSPDINWSLGNYYIRAGKLQQALQSFRKTILGDPEKRRAAFDLAWRATGDANLILAEMIPARTDIMFEYLNYLAETQRIDEAGKAWAKILALGSHFEPQAAFPYLDALIRQQRIDELAAGWAALAARNPARIRQHQADPNVITNGGFESEILNGGLDWRVLPVEGVLVSVDSLGFFDGTHSLKIQFDGKHNVDYSHVFEYVPVKPNTLYRFMGYLRAQAITTDSGPGFQIQDAYDSSKLSLSTDNLVGASNWSPQHLEFKTGPKTRLLVIRVVRPASRKFDNQIAGTVWIDRLSLIAVE
jgi:tetratricopeptide (TPR) repeat protein